MSQELFENNVLLKRKHVQKWRLVKEKHYQQNLCTTIVSELDDEYKIILKTKH